MIRWDVLSEIVSVVHLVGLETEIDQFSLSGDAGPSEKRKIKRKNPLARPRKRNTALKRDQKFLTGTFLTVIFNQRLRNKPDVASRGRSGRISSGETGY